MILIGLFLHSKILLNHYSSHFHAFLKIYQTIFQKFLQKYQANNFSKFSTLFSKCYTIQPCYHHPLFRQNQSFFSRKHTPIYRSAKRVTKSSNLDGLHVATGQHEPCNELARCVHLRVVCTWISTRMQVHT